MQHSQLNDTSQRTPEQWVNFLCISDSADDRHTLASLIDAIQTAEQYQSCGNRPCSLNVADILRNLQVDQTTLIATLLCDVRLSEQYTLDKITAEYSETISNLVKNVRWLQAFKPPASGEAMTGPEQAERLRRMLPGNGG